MVGDLIWDGVKIGLILCFMIGPIFFALVQTGVEEGFRAGSMVGLGIWFSDLSYIALVYFGISFISQLLNWNNFPLVAAVAGSILLVIFGLTALLSQPKNLYVADNAPHRKRSSYISLWLKGFLLNAVNPFTLFFWTGLMSTVIINKDLSGENATAFFGAVLGTVVVTDLSKVLLAKRIRTLLKPVHLILFRKVSGIALIFFGIVLLVRASLLL